ncbi:uncharacterized protein ALTATR162_LOCUS11372 [Alternaria atra]|uniref:Uncharacterized protein n=1 Tax=Alternaria atra TaxID=119953 RepID=A0A8J2IFJ1_9PLEO|nr:uncharacterized protein ALTATR162_LOCUS11372 [Alternaria atra]CAG5185679.1 unnamed protein product [Alternaria atra]
MGEEFAPPPGFVAWGPFVRDNYTLIRVTRADLAVAAAAFGLANFFAIIGAFIAFRQTKSCRCPKTSVYIWMIWLEIAASVAISVECLLYLLRIIRPSFYFFMSVLLCWVIQIQLLPQIIINRIRIILQDRGRGRRLIIGAAIYVTLINISVFIIWIPARLQISPRWVHINAIWDRTEKVLFLLLDGYLNWYFIHVVNADLVKNGLSKYNRLVRFNKRMIVVSLLLDVMIIGAMSTPNGFVYAMFHPLAYLVKLNIEMSMAHLIRTIALGHPHPNNDPSLLMTFSSSPGEDIFNTNMFAEVPQQRHSLIRGLFGSEHVIFSQEDNRTRIARDSSTLSASMPDYELPSRIPRIDKEPDTIAGDNPSSNEDKRVNKIHEDYCGWDSGVSSRTRDTEEGQDVPMPEAAHLPARHYMSDLD